VVEESVVLMPVTVVPVSLVTVRVVLEVVDETVVDVLLVVVDDVLVITRVVSLVLVAVDVVVHVPHVAGQSGMMNSLVVHSDVGKALQLVGSGWPLQSGVVVVVVVVELTVLVVQLPAIWMLIKFKLNPVAIKKSIAKGACKAAFKAKYWSQPLNPTTPTFKTTEPLAKLLTIKLSAVSGKSRCSLIKRAKVSKN
jgi:hypothetical protein